jgi:ElaB/YqjD/DUF883 family membrane-anchored ribosome-binding protein
MDQVTDVNKEKTHRRLQGGRLPMPKNCCAPRPGRRGDKVAELRLRVQDRLVLAKAQLADAEAAVIEKARQAGRAADDYVHENPWSSVGIAAGVGFLIGLLVGRR